MNHNQIKLADKILEDYWEYYSNVSNEKNDKIVMLFYLQIRFCELSEKEIEEVYEHLEKKLIQGNDQ